MIRVGVTSPSFPNIALALNAADLHPVWLPCVEIVPHPDALGRVRVAAVGADWLVFTSARAVELTWPDGGMPAIRAAVVGEATAAAVVRAGGRVGLVGDAGAHELIGGLTAEITNLAVVFPHAGGTAATAVDALKSAARAVVAEAIYTAKPVPPAMDPVDVVIFGSPSAVRGWCMSRALDGVAVAAIGPTTGRALIELGRRADVVPKRPGFLHVAEAVATHMQARSTS